jgi:hypothetical protein
LIEESPTADLMTRRVARPVVDGQMMVTSPWLRNHPRGPYEIDAPPLDLSLRAAECTVAIDVASVAAAIEVSCSALAMTLK